MRIIARWTFFLLVGFSSVLSLYGVYVYRREVALFDGDTRYDLVRVGHILRMQLTDMLDTGRIVAARRLVRDADQALANLQVRWVDVRATAEPLTPAERHALARGEQIIHGDKHAVTPGKTVLYLPLLSHRYAPAAIVLAQSNAGAVAYTRTTLLAIAAATGMVLVVSLLLAIALSRHLIGRPIERLVSHFKRISDGDLSRVDVVLHDEFGQLERAVDEMCGQLALSQARAREEYEARLAAVEQARQADRLATVGKLASGVAHELGTPLNVVSGLAAGISRGEYEQEEIPEAAETIAAQARRMTRIVQDVLTFVRRPRGRVERLDLNEVVTSATALVMPLARKAGVSLELPAAPACFAEVDRDHIFQVVVNLVQNAIQAQTSSGTVWVTLDTTRARSPNAPDGPDHDWVRLRVKDDGPGIAPEHLERIFDPFFTTKEVGAGTGLGLSVVHGIVEEHRGWVSVTSAPDAGAEFSVYLPAASAPAPHATEEHDELTAAPRDSRDVMVR